MTLAEMSIDEAIALACREVPECMSDPAWQDRPSVYWPATPEDDAHMTDTSHAVWFDAAWEWRAKNWSAVWPQWVESEGQWWLAPSHSGRFYPTKYHALAAACLLAAGKPVP